MCFLKSQHTLSEQRFFITLVWKRADAVSWDENKCKTLWCDQDRDCKFRLHRKYREKKKTISIELIWCIIHEKLPADRILSIKTEALFELSEVFVLTYIDCQSKHVNDIDRFSSEEIRNGVFKLEMWFDFHTYVRLNPTSVLFFMQCCKKN